jgi:5-methylcytosine-specific restriction endonuclease McrA
LNRRPETALEVLAITMRKRGVKVSIPALRAALGEATICYLCGDPLSRDTASADHVIPLAAGGEDAPVNLKWAHRICNSVKAHLTVAEFLVVAQKIIDHQTK